MPVLTLLTVSRTHLFRLGLPPATFPKLSSLFFCMGRVEAWLSLDGPNENCLSITYQSDDMYSAVFDHENQRALLLNPRQSGVAFL